MNRSSDTPSSRSADRDQSGVPGTESRDPSSPSAGADPRHDTPTGAVFCADPALGSDAAAASLPEGFAGQLSFRGADSLGYDETVSALQRLGMLVSWAQAQQARVAARLEVLFARDIADASGREEPALAMSLAAAEASTVLNIPHMTAMQLISESSRLCADAPETLTRLSEGKIAIQHARIILEETHNLPTDIIEVPEADAAGSGAFGPGQGVVDDPSSRDSGQLDLGIDGSGAQSDPDGSDEDSWSVDTDGTRTDDGSYPDSPGGMQDGRAAADGQGDFATGALTVRAAFERDLLTAAEGRTAAGFGRRARRLRESRFPDRIPVRHREAKDKRRVMFQPLPDGMSCLSAIIAAEKGQAMFAALTSAAKAGKRAGDPRTMDQLRADTLTELLLEGEPALTTTGPGSGPGTAASSQDKPGTGTPTNDGRDCRGATSTGTATFPGSSTGGHTGTGTGTAAFSGPGTRTGTGHGHGHGSRGAAFPGTGTGTGVGTGTGTGGGTAQVKPLDTPTETGSETETETETGPVPDSIGPPASTPPTNSEPKRPRRAERHRNRNRTKVRTDVMVLINADTLAGLNENPAELNGYGPISADTARTMILDALHWTPLLQDPATGEILNVGRTRRIPAGLKRWLQARDGTCRFPGCSVSVTHAEIDHTTPFSHGGPTDHTNLEHLCPKHHRFKTLGHWKARQPEPGTIEWNSPTGRTYTTDATLDYAPAQQTAGLRIPQQDNPARKTHDTDDDPPPF
ncbi:DUF222 domain-containing protein [Arthrobacter sp. 3Tela_A]|uniref:HNH endonuclease signature motif containing protein n=1 Tax=Arthrobacter sp. 3Tela_A TaxID=3093743 RepID=UPI003BB74E49